LIVSQCAGVSPTRGNQDRIEAFLGLIDAFFAAGQCDESVELETPAKDEANTDTNGEIRLH